MDEKETRGPGAGQGKHRTIRSPMPDGRKATTFGPRLWGLEILRFSSAFAILVLHYPGLCLSPFPELEGRPLVMAPWLEDLLQPFRFGPWAVQVFWILSGYIFYHQYARRVGDGEVSWRTFFVHRFSRLYPLHLVTLLSVVLLQFLYAAGGLAGPFKYNNPQNFLLHLGFASNWWEFERSFNRPVWSVSVEVLVYGLFYLVVRRFSRSAWPPILLLVPCLWLNQHKSWEGGVVECALFFFAGGLAWGVQEKVPSRLRLALATSLLLAVSVCWLAGWMHAPKTLLLLGVTPAIVALAHLPDWPRPAKIWNQLGHLTYSSYLWHFPFSLLVVYLVRKFGLDPGTLLLSETFILFLGSVLILSWFSYRWLEEPSQRWIRSRYLDPTGVIRQ